MPAHGSFHILAPSILKHSTFCVVLLKLWGLAPLKHIDVIALFSDSLPLLVILKQKFFRFINKAMDHSSPIISCASIRNQLSICNAEFRPILNEYWYDMSVNVTGQSGL